MSTPPPRDPADNRSSRPLRWRERYEAARARGVPLDPSSEPVEGVRAYPTAYDPDHLLITDTSRLNDLLGALREAAAEFGWGLRLERMDGVETDERPAIQRAQRARRDFDLPTIYRVRIVRQPRDDRDDQPVPPVDAWRLLQRARVRARDLRAPEVKGVSLDHVLTVDPIGLNPYPTKTNPYPTKTNPYPTKTNPYGLVNAPGAESYALPGSGGRQVVGYVGPDPKRVLTLAKKGRRPVVAIVDTGCGMHRWLPDHIVTRHPEVEKTSIGIAQPETDPEVIGDVSGPFDGVIDDSAGHGTFIAGVIRQVCPEADIIAVRVADSQGSVLEGDFMLAVRSLVKWMSLSARKGGRQIDVINLSLGYYHETPDDELFDQTLSELLVAARRQGCAVVCSSGNDAGDRPSFPAALWAWPDAEFVVQDPRNAAPHVSVGALNPNGTMALFSNLGPWVRTFAPGAAVLSCHPPFNGGVQPGTRDDLDGDRRETIDPDDFSGGFAVWSGTSFAAPYIAGMLAKAVTQPLMDASLTKPEKRCAALRAAEQHIVAKMKELGPLAVGS